jgi:uncharacterized coiled-coil protein SlyX
MAHPPADDDELQRRLSEAETLLMFLQRTVEELNAVILEQSRTIATHEKELARLGVRFETLADSIVELPRRPEDERPPHY